MNIKDIKYWNKYVIDRFIYTYDRPLSDTADDWKSWARPLLEDPTIKIRDDCDGLAATVAELLFIKGAQKIWRVMVGSNGKSSADHMVAMVEDDLGQKWIVGDTFNNDPIKLEKSKHNIIYINNIASGIVWTEVGKE